jgi:hypothetical protein
MPNTPDNRSRDLELPPPNIDTPDEGSMDFQQANHDSVIQNMGEDKWVDHWTEHFDKLAQGLQLPRLDQ